jgi:hypothetical protein
MKHTFKGYGVLITPRHPNREPFLAHDGAGGRMLFEKHSDAVRYKRELETDLGDSWLKVVKVLATWEVVK